MQSRFFYSSLQEIQLNVKEIHSLQVELKEAIVSKNKRTVRFDAKNPIDIDGLPRETPTTTPAIEKLSTPISIPTEIEIASNLGSKGEPSFDHNHINRPHPHHRSSSTPSSGSTLNTAQNTERIYSKNSNELPKKLKIDSQFSAFWFVFLIWEITALFVLIFLIL